MSNISSGGADPNLGVPLSYISLAGSEVPAPTQQNVHLLQHAADYQTHSRNLRYSGAFDIFWALVNGFVGYSLFHRNALNAGLFVLAAMLLGIGLWLVTNPSPIGMIYEGVVFLTMAAWNIFITYINVRAGFSVGNNFGFTVALIIWGIYRLVTYPKFAHAASMQPSAASLKWLADLAKETLKAKTDQNTNVIQCVLRTTWTYEKAKGQLLPEIAVIVSTKGNFSRWRKIQLAAKDEIEIVSAKKRLIGGWNLRLRMKDKTVKAKMPKDSFEKLTAWLQIPLATSSAAEVPVASFRADSEKPPTI